MDSVLVYSAWPGGQMIDDPAAAGPGYCRAAAVALLPQGADAGHLREQYAEF